MVKVTKIHDDKKATEYLANERTFLAWMRTSISIISLGFVVAKFGVWLRELALKLAPQAPMYSSGMSMPIGITMMGLGGVLAILAAWHYHLINLAIERGEVKANRGLVITVTASIVLVAGLMVASILVTQAHL